MLIIMVQNNLFLQHVLAFVSALWAIPDWLVKPQILLDFLTEWRGVLCGYDGVSSGLNSVSETLVFA